MSQFSANREGSDGLLAKLFPVLEVTALLRPRLLLAAFLLTEGHVLMGILYHTRKDAFQSRLRFRSAPYPDFSRRTRWRKYAEAQTFDSWTQAVGKEFGALAAKLGTASLLHLEFPPQASDTEIRQVLWSSLLPALLL